MRPLLNYCLIWPGLPPQGRPEEADCIFVQAFGRNSVKEEELPELGRRKEMIRSSEVLFDLLREDGFDPGKPNRELAETARRAVDFYGLAAFLQWEVAWTLWDSDRAWYEANRDNICPIWPPAALPKSGFNTWLVAEQSVRAMRERGLARPIELAHRRQIARAALMVSKILGRMPVTLGSEPASWDKNSVQKRVTGPLPWLCWEAPGRAYLLLTGHIL